LVARFFERCLQLLHLAVEIFLPLGKLAQSAEHLACFALFGLLLSSLLRRCRALGFVSILRLGKIELVELLLRAIASAAPPAASLLAVAAYNFVFARPQLEQRLIRRLFRRQRRPERIDRRPLLGTEKLGHGSIHMVEDGF
jgi:hypothetical protein